MAEEKKTGISIDRVRNNEIVQLPVLPLRGLVVYNNILLHFDVGREQSVKSLEKAMEEGQHLFLVAQKEVHTDHPTKDDLYEVGTISKVKQILRMPGDNMRVMVEGVQRGVLLELDERGEHLSGRIQVVKEHPIDVEDVTAMGHVNSLRDAYEDYASFQPKPNNEVAMKVMDINHPGKLADFLASSLPLRLQDKQIVLEAFDPLDRAEKLTSILRKEMDVMEVEVNVAQKVKEQLDKNQREYVLREQIKAIQSELGDTEGVQVDCEVYRAKIDSLKLEDEIREKLLKEVDRLEHTVQGSAEGMVIRTYLDTCLALPWNITTKERTGIERARKMLDEDHYGMEKVKEHILEVLAVKQLKQDSKGQIICLVGPPGVGKTSVGKSIARAMNRKFARLSLGGVRDEADIRGHRKTYIGAMPGRIINALSQSGSKNCVLLLDEIDKMASDFRGDPAAALLEVLDSEQNKAFRDHYIEVPFDLSEVMFILTANTLDTIPRPLLDRMEVIELGSYTQEEKVHIAKDHLIPKVMKNHGIEKKQLQINEAALNAIIEGYTRESGVRNLERTIAKICRKAAVKLVEGKAKKIVITPKNLTDYLGKVKFLPDAVNKQDEVGVVCGLAWTQVGGEILYVEVNVVNGTGKIELTGSLGDVMKESASAAISYIRKRSDLLGIDPDFYKDKDIHVHFPQGAVPKDGPSAGITMATAITSALTGIPVKHDVAMTGEVTIRGRVMAIGGLREKTMAAYKHGMKTIIIPKENQQDLEDVDPAVKEHVQFVFASTMDDVLDVALTCQPQPLPPKPDKEEKAESMPLPAMPKEQGNRICQ